MTRRLFAFLVLSLLLFGVQPARAHVRESNQVGLVVRLGSASTIAQCITFSEPEISGYDVLDRSGLDLVVADGAAARLLTVSVTVRRLGIPACSGITGIWRTTNG